MPHWITHLLGIDDANGEPYLFWSGVAPNLDRIALVALIWRHVNCHEPRCHRIGTHRLPDGTLTCRQHR